MKAKRQFDQKISEVTFDNTSPLEKLSTTIHRLSKTMDAGIQVTKSTSVPTNHPQCEGSSTSIEINPTYKSGSMFSKTNNQAHSSSRYPRTDSNKERETEKRKEFSCPVHEKRSSCPVHDARQFMFSSYQDIDAGIPYSNSTFAAAPKATDHTTESRGKEQRSRTVSPDSVNHNTLVWDNFIETNTSWDNNPRKQHVQSKSTSNAYGKTRWSDCNSRASNNDKESTKFADHYTDVEIESVYEDDPITKRRSTSNYSQRKVEFEEPKDPKYRDKSESHYRDQSTGESKYRDKFHDSESNFRDQSTGEESHRDEEFQHSKGNYFGQPSWSSGGHQSMKSFVPSQYQQSGQIKQDQIAARHVVDKKLPNFFGDPSEWPIWYHQYKNSTALCGFTDDENLDRLQRCLKGKASKRKGEEQTDSSTVSSLDNCNA